MNPFSTKSLAILAGFLGSSYSTSFDLTLGYENKNCTGRITYFEAKPSSLGFGSSEKNECYRARKTIRGATNEKFNLILEETETDLNYFFQSEEKETDGFYVLGSCMADQGVVSIYERSFKNELSLKYILEELLDGTPVVKRLGYESDNCLGSPIVEEVSVVFMAGPIYDRLLMKLLPSKYKVLRDRFTQRLKQYGFNYGFNQGSREAVVAWHNPLDFNDPKESVVASHNPLNYNDKTRYDKRRIDLVMKINHSYFNGDTTHVGTKWSIDNFIVEHFDNWSDGYESSEKKFLNQRIAAERLVEIGNDLIVLMVPIDKCRFMGGFKEVGSDIFSYHVNADGQKVLQRQTFSDDHCKVLMGPARIIDEKKKLIQDEKKKLIQDGKKKNTTQDVATSTTQDVDTATNTPTEDNEASHAVAGKSLALFAVIAISIFAF